MSSFIKDLSDEGFAEIKHSLIRCKKEEPLTIWYSLKFKKFKCKYGF